MQHLADALGLQRGSLYAHIGSKEELLLEVVNDGASRFLDRGRRALEMDASSADKLRTFLTGHMETVAEHLDAATVFLNEWRYLSDDLRAAVSAQRDQYEAMARTLVEEGVASGEFRTDADIRFASMLLLSAGNWMYEWYRPGGDLAPDEIAQRFCELVLLGLETR